MNYNNNIIRRTQVEMNINKELKEIENRLDSENKYKC